MDGEKMRQPRPRAKTAAITILWLALLGAAMALSIPAMTWLKQASLLLVLAGVAVVGLAIAFWPRSRKASP